MASDGSALSGPRDAAVMEAILKEMGVEEYEPAVVHQMLEFSYRYITNVLEDARLYSEHASKKEIDVADVRLAIQNRMDHSFTTPPPRDFLIELARQKNSTPLPLIPEKFGPRLPPERYCLTANNYKIKDSGKTPSLAKPQVTLAATFRLPLSKQSTAAGASSSSPVAVGVTPSLHHQLGSPLLQATTASTATNVSSSSSSSASSSHPPLPQLHQTLAAGVPSLSTTPAADRPSMPTLAPLVGAQRLANSTAGETAATSAGFSGAFGVLGRME